jgi:hypothetical protein
MTKKDVLDILEEDYSAADLREVARSLRDDYEYLDLKISHGKDALLDEIEEGVAKQDLVAVLNASLPGWDEEEDDDSDAEED